MLTKTRLLAIAVLALGTSLGVAACGGGGVGSGANEKVETVQVSAKPSGDLTISNWPYYIDKQTVPDFEKATGIDVTYHEDVNDNAAFFGKMQPLLAKGESGGRSIIVVTDWMAKKMHDLGYVQDLDYSNGALSNVQHNLLPTLKSPAFDPNRDFSVPWQSGMTGLIVNTDLAPDVQSINDLFDPKYKGQVEMLTELRDTVPLVMKSQGIDLKKATEKDWICRTHRLVGRRDSAPGRQSGDRVPDADGGLHALVGQHGDPRWSPESHRRGSVDELRLRPQEPDPDRRVQLLHDARAGSQGDLPADRPAGRAQSADLPDRPVHEELRHGAASHG